MATMTPADLNASCKHKFIKIIYEKSLFWGLIKFRQENVVCEKCGIVSNWKEVE